MLKRTNFATLSKQEMKQVVGGNEAIYLVSAGDEAGVSCQFSGHPCGANGKCISSFLDVECCCSMDEGNAECNLK